MFQVNFHVKKKNQRKISWYIKYDQKVLRLNYKFFLY